VIRAELKWAEEPLGAAIYLHEPGFHSLQDTEDTEEKFDDILDHFEKHIDDAGLVPSVSLIEWRRRGSESIKEVTTIQQTEELVKLNPENPKRYVYKEPKAPVSETFPTKP
jgi:hypothetical protein